MKQLFLQPLREILAAWNRFWFDSSSEDTLASLGLFRICFCSVLWFCYFSRSFDLDFFYSEGGIMPSAYRTSLEVFRFRPSILDGISSVGTLQVWHALFLVSLAMLALGLFTRAAALVTYLLHMMFLNRNMAILFGVDTVGTFFLLYLCFTRCGARYSLDSWLRQKSNKQTVFSNIAWRLMQLQVCIVYGYSGLEKLKGSRWWDGSALWDVLSAGNIQRWDMSFLAHAPLLLASSVYLVLLWELYFPILIWNSRLRLPMLAFGLFMHMGIVLFMSLPSFGFMMISLYALFLKKQEIEAGLRLFASIRRKLIST